MKTRTFFSLVNVTLGVLLLVVGGGVLVNLTRHPASAAAGVVALISGGACLWLAKQSAFAKPAQAS